MPAVRIPFDATQASGHEERAGAPPLALNALVDAARSIYPFPGSSTWADFPSTIPNASAVIGMTDWKGKLVYVTEDRKAWAVDGPGLVTALSDSTTATKLGGDGLPVFAKTEDRLFIAGGQIISYWTGTGTLTQMSSSVPTSTHIVAVVSRLVAPEAGESGQLYWTDAGPGNHLTGWRALNTANAEARPDKVLALHDNAREIFAFGPETVQAFEPDAAVDFLPLPADNEGLLARYSVINLLRDRAFAWLTPGREFVVGTGRGQTTVISKPIAKTIQDLVTLDDCVGFRVVLRDHELLIWRFPTAGRTFAYDVERKRWFELGARDSVGARINWPVKSYHYWADNGAHLVGLSTGEIQKLDADATTIGGYAYHAEVETGYQSHASEAFKQTIELRMAAKRGVITSGSTVPTITVGFRDKPGNWREIRFSLGDYSDTIPVIRKRIVAKPYPRRDWLLKIPAGQKVVGVEELFEPLEE